MDPMKKMNNDIQKIVEQARAVKSRGEFKMFLPEEIKAKWHPEIHAADNDDETATINIYDIVGEDWFSQGMTSKIVNSVLRKNKGKAVTVNINSPGGDYFEGLAIYNLLREHDGEVNIKILGMAASVASVIAMAGDNIKIADAGFLMIHNAWSCCCGNKEDMRAWADVLEQFDSVMIDIYTKKTGMDPDEITQMCNDETWINGKDSVEMKFATGFLDSDDIDVDEKEDPEYNSSLKIVDRALAKDNKTRSERRKILKDLTGTPCATVEPPDQLPCADQNLNDAIASLSQKLTIER